MKRRDFLNKVLLTGGYCAFPFNSPIFSLDKPAFNEKELQTPKFLIQYIGDNTDYYQKLKHSLSNYPVILKKFD
ncbi:hypothetical protein KAJ27_05550, partial [bacterium]|nr:hypothetical protein [bacterium]